MKKNIEKRYEIEDDTITITLLDPRDNYIHELALGVLGHIFISEEGTMIGENSDPSMKIEMLRKKMLYQAFEEIFGTKEFNPLSNECYKKIKTMIANGTLEALGYKKAKEPFLTEPTKVHYRK